MHLPGGEISQAFAPVSSQIVVHLLNRMRDFNEWSQCVVLELLASYKPESQEETFNIMNLLEERLRHSNSAVVLAATKVFLNFTQDMPAVHQQVFSRLKAPMLTLMTAGVFEQASQCPFLALYHPPRVLKAQGINIVRLQAFICLKHIALLTQRVPDVFASEFKQ